MAGMQTCRSGWLWKLLPLPNCNSPTRIQELAKIYLCSPEKVSCLFSLNLTEMCMNGWRKHGSIGKMARGVLRYWYLEYWKRCGQEINLLPTILLNGFYCCCCKFKSTYGCVRRGDWEGALLSISFSTSKPFKHTHKHTHPIIMHTNEDNAENWANTILDQWSVNKLYKTTRQVHTPFGL